MDADGLRVAWSIEDRFRLSFWDSLIVAAAHVAACDVLLTEDLQHEADLDRVRVLDPFRTSTGELQGSDRSVSAVPFRPRSGRRGRSGS
jgi:hypothetical protein